jgi:hypothetical protein
MATLPSGSSALSPQQAALANPEAVLFINHSQSQAPELHTLLDEGVGADDNHRFSLLQTLAKRAFFFFLQGADEQAHLDPFFIQQA